MRFKKPNETDQDVLEVTSDVKKIMQTAYEAIQGDNEVVQGEILPESSLRDENFIVTFGELGNKKEEETFSESFRKVIKYNKNGVETEENSYYLEKLMSRMTYALNDRDMRTETLHIDGDGTISIRTVRTYNDTYQTLESTTYHNRNGEMVVTEKSVHTYSDEINHIHGRPLRNTLTQEEYKGGKIYFTASYTYNEEGRMLEHIIEYPEPNQAKGQKITYKYNEHGHTIENNSYNHDGTLKNSYSMSWVYDKDGNRILPPVPEIVEKKDPLESEIVETDHRGNWIKKTVFYNQKPSKILIRELVYEGEEKTFEHPLSKIQEAKAAEEPVKPEYGKYDLEKPNAQWLVESSNASVENFSAVRYYALRFRAHPSVKQYVGPNIDALALREILKKRAKADEIHSYSTGRDDDSVQRYTLLFPMYWGYMLQATGITSQKIDKFIIPPTHRNHDDGYVFTSSFTLLRPNEYGEHRNPYFEEYITGIISECVLEKKPNKPVINIIEVNGSDFSVEEYAVHDDFIIKDLDVNYGQGFEKFHNALIERFNTTTKGLVLFHGLPGTGKTFYIRHLLRTMVANNKRVIYIPPNLVDYLVNPEFMTFLSAELKRWLDSGHTCVLLIEDAEPLLAKRQEGVRVQGVTNLLNLTDGLLNDMLNIQIICTFNVEMNKLDSALLRPGRLIARKEFTALPVLDANLLAQRLGINHQFKKPATLGQIYGMLKNNTTLVHDVDTDEISSATIDDFL